MVSIKNFYKNSAVIRLKALKALVEKGGFLQNLFRFRKLELLTPKIEYLPYPFLTALSLRLLSRGHSSIKDDLGNTIQINLPVILKLLVKSIVDLMKAPFLLIRVNKDVNSFLSLSKNEISKPRLDLSRTPVYLRTDHIFGISAGGSISHISGVLNNLDQTGTAPVLLTTNIIPTIRPDLLSLLLQPNNDFQDFSELPAINFTSSKFPEILSLLKNIDPSFIYQRYSVHNYSGTQLASHLKVPLVLEYNGSEIWAHQHWSKELRYKKLAEQIELLNLNYADVVVVVSRALENELLSRGIESDKILTNPNGVDPGTYFPQLDGSALRSRFDLNGKIVLGFIGTFGPWHGAEILAGAYGLLLQKYPEYKKTTRLFMIGDGKTMPLVKTGIANFNIESNVCLTGTVPQEKGPEYLAACDLLVSPHVPNSDGTPFFGSPTKLFEYMAMGKGIIASDLDQIGEILKHNETAWMVKPGDAESLMHGLKTMIDHPETARRLGEVARREVVANYTWKEHTRKIIEKLKERCPCK